jgi:hypothetical protein
MTGPLFGLLCHVPLPLVSTSAQAPSLSALLPTGPRTGVLNWQDAHVEEIVTSASLIMIGHAAFHAAVEQYPRTRLTLRHGARIILKSPEWLARCLPVGEATERGLPLTS